MVRFHKNFFKITKYSMDFFFFFFVNMQKLKKDHKFKLHSKIVSRFNDNDILVHFNFVIVPVLGLFSRYRMSKFVYKNTLKVIIGSHA